jgi:hypothetical protein
MSDMLDDMPDDNLRDKLKNYSEEPDDHLWEKIESGIQRPDVPLSKRLNSYEESPDDFVWKRINRSLWVDKTFNWIDRAGQLAAVATIIFLIAIGVGNDRIYLNKIESTEKSEIQNDINDAGKKDSLIAKAETVKPNAPGAKDLGSENPALELPALQHRKERRLIEKRAGATIEKAIQVGNVKNEDSGQELKKITEAVAISGDSVSHAKETLESNAGHVVVWDDFQSVLHNKNAMDSLRNNNRVVDSVKSQPTVQNIQIPAKEKKKTKRNKGFYTLIMPTFGYQRIMPVKNDNILIESLQKISAFSTKRLGIRAEIGIEKALSKKMTAHVGLLYFHRKQTINYTYRDTNKFTISKLETDSLSYQVTSQKADAAFEYELKNIGIIAGVNYTIKSKRLIQKLGLAGELQKGLNAVSGEVATGQELYLFGDVYYRIAYPLSPKIDLMFQPTINYSLQLDSRLTAPFYVKPYGLGLNFGAYFHF